jgi:hypothetical protein
MHGRSQRATAHQDIEHLTLTLAEAMGLPASEAFQRAVKDYDARLDAAPPLSKYPELKGIRECLVAYNRGYAEGAGISEEDVALLANHRRMITAATCHTPPSEPPSDSATVSPGCTRIFFPTSDRGPLLANNLDIPFRPDYRPDPFWPTSNQAGLIMTGVSSGLFDDEESPEIFPVPVFSLASETCGKTAEAVELLTRLHLFWDACNLLVADKEGKAAVIEKSACRYGVRKVEDGFAATTGGAAEEPVYKSYLWETRERSLTPRGLDHDSYDWAYWKASEGRSARLLKLVNEAKRNPTYSSMESVIYDHTGRMDQIHLDGSKCHPDQQVTECTQRTIIWVLNEKRAWYSFAEPPVWGHETQRHRKDFEKVELVF